MLIYLEISPENSASIKELVTEMKLLLEEEVRKFVMKFIEKLEISLKNGTTIESSKGGIENNTEQTDNTNSRTYVNSTFPTENNADHSDNTRNRIVENETTKEGENNSIDEYEKAQTVTDNNKNKEDRQEITEDDNSIDENKDIPQIKIPKRIPKGSTINDHKVNKKQAVEENNYTETDSDNCNNERRSKRQRTHLISRFDQATTTNMAAKKYNRMKMKSTAIDNNISEADSDINEEEKTPPLQRRVLRQPDPGEIKKKQISSVNIRNNKNLENFTDTVVNTKNKEPEKNVNNESDTTGEETDREENKVKRYLKRTRQGMSKPISVTKKYNTRNDKKVQNTNSIITNTKDNKNNKVNDAESDTTTDREIDSENNRELRRSKRPRRSLEKLDFSDGSKGSEKENKSKNTENQSVQTLVNIPINNKHSIQTRRSTGQRLIDTDLTNYSSLGQPTAESTKNNIHRTSNNSIGNSPAGKNSEVSVNGVKRRKSRGKKSQDLDSTRGTTLHTIIEQSQRISILEDDASFHNTTSNSSSRRSSRSQNTSVFSTPSTTSRRSKLIISETSSDSE
ncbi:hypothetical protein NQ314_015376 [Rhamnusium bicolor]|uniref:Uncharacterized protein n=1 Tax=Rhamnusium bicolor TaxID=1586634 RepID=A0AAV8X179_9CUCU|nr:hypothetical protein NQ314_015376 [Rhamnusium bicolor]